MKLYHPRDDGTARGVASRDLAAAREGLLGFVHACRKGPIEYALTPRAEPTPYARCFGVYCATLCGAPPPEPERQALAAALRAAVRAARVRPDVQVHGKPYRQLLAFTLTALRALDALATDPLADLIDEQLPVDVRDALERHGCLAGAPGSGNQAMFVAVFLLHAAEALGIDTRARVNAWVELHLARMNRFGFWGSDRGMTHLQFQNGYHQYEIFEYLGVRNPRGDAAIRAVRSLADRHGHFAPYPGGGGCYDYDAVFVLTPRGEACDAETRDTLSHTMTSLLSEQQSDGGFAESLQVRPRSTANVGAFAGHVVRGARNPRLLLERTRYALALQRPAHDRIHTHWSEYSRGWHESNLWDSWFRMMTLARIQIALGITSPSGWGFIDFPGIGFHPGARRSATAS